MTFDIQSHSPCTKDFFLFQRDKFKKSEKVFTKSQVNLHFKELVLSLRSMNRLNSQKLIFLDPNPNPYSKKLIFLDPTPTQR